MTLTSLGGVSNSSSMVFTNSISTIARINYNRVANSMNNYEYCLENLKNYPNDPIPGCFCANTKNKPNTEKSLWSGSYNNRIIY